MRGSVVIYMFKNKLFVHTFSTTTTGAGIGTDNVEVAERSLDSLELGRLVRRMLSLSSTGLPHPTDFKKLTEVLLNLAGVKSWNSFGNCSDSCSVSVVNERYTILPHRKYKKQGAKIGVMEAKQTLSEPSDSGLGLAVLEALKVSAEAKPEY